MVRDIVQETGIKTIPKKKKCKKAKWLSREALEIAVKRREAKSKGEKERYTHLNAEFQRIARRDKKAFLNDQCKEIEENNRMGKTRDLFKKIRDTKGTFHTRVIKYIFVNSFVLWIVFTFLLVSFEAQKFKIFIIFSLFFPLLLMVLAFYLRISKSKVIKITPVFSLKVL